jgi:hypothetical protein
MMTAGTDMQREKRRRNIATNLYLVAIIVPITAGGILAKNNHEALGAVVACLGGLAALVRTARPSPTGDELDRFLSQRAAVTGIGITISWLWPYMALQPGLDLPDLDPGAVLGAIGGSVLLSHLINWLRYR